MSLPTSLTAGDTKTFSVRYDGYPSSDWTLTVYLNGPSSLNVTGTAGTDDSFNATFTAAHTANLSADLYTIVARVSKAGEVHTVESNNLTVLPNPAYKAHTVNTAYRMVQLIDLALLEQLSDGQAIEVFSIAGRSFNLANRKELLEERAFWVREYDRTRRAKMGSPRLRSTRISGLSF